MLGQSRRRAGTAWDASSAGGSMDRMSQIPSLVHELTAAWGGFGRVFRPPAVPPVLFLDDFSLIWGAYLFDLRVWDNGHSLHPNGVTPDGRLAHVDAVACESWDRHAQDPPISVDGQSDHLIVLLTLENGRIEVVYNGPTSLAWRSGKPSWTGCRSVAISTLGRLMKTVPESRRLPLVRPLPKRAARTCWSPAAIDYIPPLLSGIWAAAAGLNRLFRKYRFTPIHLWQYGRVEACAACLYDTVPLDDSLQGKARTRTAAGASLDVETYDRTRRRACVSAAAEHLLVLELDRDGKPREVYNGPNALAWANASRIGTAGPGEDEEAGSMRTITGNKLRKLMRQVPKAKRVPMVRYWPMRDKQGRWRLPSKAASSPAFMDWIRVESDE